MTRKDELLEAALNHALFDGFSQATINAACADLGMTPAEAKALLPKGPIDLALAYHRKGDRLMVELLRAEDLSAMRFRDRIAHSVRLRLEVADRELVRRGFALFALPQHAATGSRALWETADHIWTTLGDTSRDINCYTTRASLSAVFSATALYWLGDESTDYHATWEFLNRRIENVMQFEKVKAQAKQNPLGKAFMAGPGKLFDLVHAPQHAGHGK